MYRNSLIVRAQSLAYHNPFKPQSLYITIPQSSEIWELATIATKGWTTTNSQLVTQPMRHKVDLRLARIWHCWSWELAGLFPVLQSLDLAATFRYTLVLLVTNGRKDSPWGSLNSLIKLTVYFIVRNIAKFLWNQYLRANKSAVCWNRNKKMIRLMAQNAHS